MEVQELTVEIQQKLNDLLRRALCNGEIRNDTPYTFLDAEGQVRTVKSKLMTSARVFNLPTKDQMAIVKEVADFDAFTEDNDPYKEHDFGVVQYKGEKYNWKWDYLDKELECFGHDCHVLTIYHWSEN